MRIHFERSGGFAGLRLEATVDTETLPAETADTLRQLVRAAHVFDLPALMAPANPGADRFCYQLTIEDRGRRRVIEACESAIPGELQPLLRFLTARARSARA